MADDSTSPTPDARPDEDLATQAGLSRGQSSGDGAAASGVPRIDARRLRELAEEAAGRPESNLALVRDPNPDPKAGNPKVVVWVEETNDVSEVFLRARTADPAPKKLRVHLPDVKKPKKPPKEDGSDTGEGDLSGGVEEDDHEFGDICDAIFWSSAAVQKFLYPYYSQLLSLDEMKKQIEDVFRKEEVLAMAHLPNSEVEDMESEGGDRQHVESRGFGLAVIEQDAESGKLTIRPFL